MWIHRSIRLVLMLVCIALGIMASLAYEPRFRQLLPYMVSSFAVVVLQPVVMMKSRFWLLEPVIYAFHLASSVTLIVYYNGVPLRHHGVEIAVLLAFGSCFLMGLAMGCQKTPDVSDVESAATASLDELSLNRTHEKPEMGKKISQKTLVNREALGSTLHSDLDPDMVSKAMASNSLDDYCKQNWMSPLLQLHLTPALRDTNLFDVHRLKLVNTLHVSKRPPKKRQWQLIHDEKVFLLGVSEKLLPSVLKLGESPIQNTRRSFDNYKGMDDGGSPQRTQYHTPRASPSRESFEKTNFANSEKNARTSFDRHSAIMEGLEEIPTAQAPPWARGTAGTGIRLISLQDWEQNKALWMPGQGQEMLSQKIMNQGQEIIHLEGQDVGAFVDLDEEIFGKSIYTKSRSDGDFMKRASRDSRFNTASRNTENQPPYDTQRDSLTQTENPRLSFPGLTLAPSLHTYRRNSEGSNRRLVYAFEQENALKQCVTPTQVPDLPIIQSTNSSPIKKVMGMFKRRGLEAEFGSSYSFAYQHKHQGLVANSTTSHTVLMASGKSSTGLPRKAIRSFLKGLLHKSASSVNYTPNNPPPVPPAPPPIPILFNMPKDPLFRHSTELMQQFRVPSDEWDMSEATALDQLRVSSLPSAIIGEYDKEKWRKLKELEALQAQRSGMILE